MGRSIDAVAKEGSAVLTSKLMQPIRRRIVLWPSAFTALLTGSLVDTASTYEAQAALGYPSPPFESNPIVSGLMEKLGTGTGLGVACVAELGAAALLLKLTEKAELARKVVVGGMFGLGAYHHLLYFKNQISIKMHLGQPVANLESAYFAVMDRMGSPLFNGLEGVINYAANIVDKVF